MCGTCALSHSIATPWTVAHQTPLSMEILLARILDWAAMPSPPGSLRKSGIKPRSPTLQVDSLPSEPLEKPQNTGVDSVSLLQEIFPTKELNWCLLHCKQILYQLSYQGRVWAAVRDGEGQGNLACCSPWSHKELDTT